MIGRETRVLLRHYLEQGMSKAAIARQVGISPRTVYRWIAAGQLDRELDDGAVRYCFPASGPTDGERPPNTTGCVPVGGGIVADILWRNRPVRFRLQFVQRRAGSDRASETCPR